jgi:aminopeptidase N
LPEDAAGGRRVLRWVAESLDFFNQTFGPYPFAEFDAVATPTIAGGIEYPGLIVLPIRNYDQTGGNFQWAAVHEVGHQWWYSLVGNDQQDEPWLDEAITQYSTALFYEFREEWDAVVEEMFEARYQEVAGTENDDLISRPVAAYAESDYGTIVYAKGPLFFHALRQRVGDETFFALLQTYFDSYRYRIASGSDLLAVIDQMSGQDLSDLYQQWLAVKQ